MSAQSDASHHSSAAGSEHGDDTLTLRALVSTKEAGIIIGKGGKNVAALREGTGARAGVSKVVPGVQERILTVSGTAESVSRAFELVITQLVEGGSTTPAPAQPAGVPAAATSTSSSPHHLSLRLLISHNLMGTLIGRQGIKIKAIQDHSGARMTAAKDMLPQSTERIVEVSGAPESVARAISEICRSLLEDWDRGVGTVLYHPTNPEDTRSSAGRRSAANGSVGGTRSRNGLSSNGATGRAPRGPPPNASDVVETAGLASVVAAVDAANGGDEDQDVQTQTISIPTDMVGCIIGRAGTKITEIRRLSGSKISIAKTPHDETGERLFTIVGTRKTNEKALFLLYNQLESEKERRVGRNDAVAAEGLAAGEEETTL